MTSRPQLTLQTSDAPALPAGQPLSEELVAVVRNQFPQQSYTEINCFVSDWQQQTAAPVTVRQTTTSLKWTAQHIGMHGLAVRTSPIF